MGTQTVEDVQELAGALNESQRRWLTELAGAQRPELSAAAMLGRLVEEAIAAHRERSRRRHERLEIYLASGYSEHHPDYPDVPRGLSDV